MYISIHNLNDEIAVRISRCFSANTWSVTFDSVGFSTYQLLYNNILPAVFGVIHNQLQFPVAEAAYEELN